MNKWNYKLKKFNEIYNDQKKIELDKNMIKLKNNISKLFYNQKLSLDFFALSVYKTIYIIEKQDLSFKELEKIVYSLSYFFLKDYIDVKKLIDISGMDEAKLKNESEKSLELLKKSYKTIEKKEMDIESIFIDFKKFIEWEKNEKK